MKDKTGIYIIRTISGTISCHQIAIRVRFLLAIIRIREYISVQTCSSCLMTNDTVAGQLILHCQPCNTGKVFFLSRDEQNPSSCKLVSSDLYPSVQQITCGSHFVRIALMCMIRKVLALVFLRGCLDTRDYF